MGAPRITINGINATSGPEGQLWPFVSGPVSPEVPVVVHAELDAALGALEPPVSLEIQGVHREGLHAVTSEIKIKNLFLTRRESVVRGHRIRWFISDVRWFLSKLWVFSDFSIRRPLNEFLRFGVGDQRAFHQTPKLAYIPHTNAKFGGRDTDPQFASGDTDPEVHQPWTAKQACLWMLKGFFATEEGRCDPPGLGAGWHPEVVDDASDNLRLLADFRTNRPWPAVMARLLGLAHIGMFVDKDGRFVLYDLDPTGLPERVGGYAGGGQPIIQDASRSRPRRVRVYFRTERELRFDYFERVDVGSGGSSAQRGKRDISRLVENVLILPQDVRDVNTGRVHQRGTVETILEACRLWNQDPDNPPPALLSKDGKPGGRVTFSLDFIRENIMSPSLATRLTLLPRFANAEDNVFAARAAVLYQSYRQQFRLAPVWLDLIESLRPERCAIMDPVSGKRAPSPVFMDYFTEYSARYFHYKGAPKDLKAGQNVYAWNGPLRNITDFARLPLTEGQAAPAVIAMVNARQLIFRVSFLPDLYGNAVHYYPTTFADDRVPVTLLGGLARTWILSQMAYAPTFRLSTVFSCTLRTPNDHRKYFFRDFDQNGAIEGEKTAADASGPNHESLFSMIHAGIAWLDRDQADPQGKILNEASDAQVEQTPNGGEQVVVVGGALTNPVVLEDAARAVLADVKFQSQDRVVGTYAGPGIDADRDHPRGEIASVILRHANGRIEAFHDASQPPVPPPIWELLPQKTQNFLFRLEGDPEQ